MQPINLNTLSDEALLHQSIEKPSLFAHLVDRYQKAFLRKALPVVRSEETAEDVVQDTFIKIYRHAHTFQKMPGASFKSWAYKILMNTAFTAYQKSSRHNERTITLEPEESERLPDTNSWEKNSQFLPDYLSSVFVRMNPVFSTVLKKYFLEGKSHQEIADEEGVSAGVIRTRMHRAKKEFRKIDFTTLSI